MAANPNTPRTSNTVVRPHNAHTAQGLPTATPHTPTNTNKLNAASTTLKPTSPIPDPRLTNSDDVDTTGGIVTVRVGEPARDFYIHRGILTKSSAFLKSKAKPEWSKPDPSEEIVSLPDHLPEAFVVYSKWLYLGGIVVSSARDSNGTPLQGDEHSEWLYLAHAYVLGEALLDVNFKDAVADALRAKLKGPSGATIWPVAPQVVNIIYAGTPDKSPVRKFLVDLYQIHAGAEDLNPKTDLAREFLLDLSRVCISRRDKTPMSTFGPYFGITCNYHDHGVGRTCYTKRQQQNTGAVVKPGAVGR